MLFIAHGYASLFMRIIHLVPMATRSRKHNTLSIEFMTYEIVALENKITYQKVAVIEARDFLLQ